MAKFYTIKANVMAIKSYLMDEVSELRTEISSLTNQQLNIKPHRNWQ